MSNLKQSIRLVVVLGSWIAVAHGGIPQPQNELPKPLGSLPGHDGWAFCLAFSPDGRLLASGGSDKTVQLWNFATGKVVAKLEGHPGSVWSVAFSPDGKTLVSGSGFLDRQRMAYTAGEIRVWDVAERRLRATHKDHTRMVNSLVFTADGRFMASASDDGTVKLWDFLGDDLKLARTPSDANAVFEKSRKRPTDAILAAAVSPDGRLLAWGDSESVIRVWDTAGGREAKPLLNAGSVRSLTFSPDGKTLVAGCYDSLRAWDVATGNEWPTHKEQQCIHTVAFSPDGKTLVTGDNIGVVKAWDLLAGTSTSIGQEKNIAIYCLRFNSAGTLLAGARSDGSVVLWDASGDKK